MNDFNIFGGNKELYEKFKNSLNEDVFKNIYGILLLPIDNDPNIKAEIKINYIDDKIFSDFMNNYYKNFNTMYKIYIKTMGEIDYENACQSIIYFAMFLRNFCKQKIDLDKKDDISNQYLVIAISLISIISILFYPFSVEIYNNINNQLGIKQIELKDDISEFLKSIINKTFIINNVKYLKLY